MWHPLSRVAENYRWDEKVTESFIKFAEEREEQYGLDMTPGHETYVNTWHVDKLVEDFNDWSCAQAELRDEYNEDRRGPRF